MDASGARVRQNLGTGDLDLAPHKPGRYDKAPAEGGPGEDRLARSSRLPYILPPLVMSPALEAPRLL